MCIHIIFIIIVVLRKNEERNRKVIRVVPLPYLTFRGPHFKGPRNTPVDVYCKMRIQPQKIAIVECNVPYRHSVCILEKE